MTQKTLDGEVVDNSGPTHGGPRIGVGAILKEIDPDTLPEGDPWPEVGRRIKAARAGLDGWETGDIQRQQQLGRGERP